MRLTQVVEAGLGHLPFTEKTVVTPTGRQYVGVDFAKKLCGVSIIRSGESMENALRACCKGVKIGKILVHRWEDTLHRLNNYGVNDLRRFSPEIMLRRPSAASNKTNCIAQASRYIPSCTK